MLKEASMTSGAHSVSDYARDLVCAGAFPVKAGNEPRGSRNPASLRLSAPSHFRLGLATTRVEAEVAALRSHFEDLKTELKQLTERVQQIPPRDL